MEKTGRHCGQNLNIYLYEPYVWWKITIFLSTSFTNDKARNAHFFSIRIVEILIVPPVCVARVLCVRNRRTSQCCSTGYLLCQFWFVCMLFSQEYVFQLSIQFQIRTPRSMLKMSWNCHFPSVTMFLIVFSVISSHTIALWCSERSWSVAHVKWHKRFTRRR